MTNKRIKQLRAKFDQFNIDGYVVPKNDEFFSEYSQIDRLKFISNFTGSAGVAVILKKKNYLFVDGRYTIQAKIESGKFFKISDYNEIINCKIFKNLTLGIDPKIFTSNQIKKFFIKNNKIKNIDLNLVDSISKVYYPKNKPFFSLGKDIVGESHFGKIRKVTDFLKKKGLDYLFVSAPENVAWLLNIRGYDNPNSPIPNCRLIINKKKDFFLIAEHRKVKRIIKEKRIFKKQLIEPHDLIKNLDKFRYGKILLDEKSCSIFYQNLFKKNLKIINNEDPIYLFKSIKSKREINFMKNSHILDGVALTKFLYWIKKINKKKITELSAQNKLESFRKKNLKYLFPSFNTIAGTGKNAAIVHYRAEKKTTKKINKKDIFLLDSGGQYKYGTTDVTRTICFSEPKKEIKDIFTRVLQGHIGVVTANLNKKYNGKLLDAIARKNLKKIGLDYQHGTGHGVGFFLNVHEGPQAISKFNKVKLLEGMVLSNEPGYYRKNKFGIRIENLVYVKKLKNKLVFENLTMAPIDNDLINFEKLNKDEKHYLLKYHLDVYSKLSKFLSGDEKKWLASLI